MKQFNQNEKKVIVDNSRMAKLHLLNERASKLNKTGLKERVAVPDSSGGYVMVVREIES